MESKLGLSKMQIFFLVVNAQVGIGMLTLPNKLQETSKHDGWISIILTGLCIQCILFIYWLLLRRFPNSNYHEITRSILGKHLGKLCNLATFIYLIMTTAYLLLVSVKLIREILLDRTPSWVLGLLIFTMCMYLCTSSIHVFARIILVHSVLFLFLFILSFFPYTLNMDFRNIFPIGSSGLKNIIFGFKESYISFLGFEIILFLYPLAADKNKAFLKNISYINLFVSGLTVYLTILATLVFNSNLLAQLKYPIIYMFRPLQFEALDRMDLIFFSMWAIPLVLSVSVFLFFSNVFLKYDGKHRSFPVTGILIFALFLLAKKSNVMLDYYLNFVTLYSYFIIGIIPLTLLLISAVLRIKEKGETI
ncbi:GerAB/ArcD/ProY family transporter [Cytobacillus sp. BC1816]|uniref:GerAB/ArcD/ProY family transporter n=1 Tax=Cytobacillus sp. BC1816 TaxID=3440154 RepID=UPI003F512CE3